MDSPETTKIIAQVQCNRCQKIFPADAGRICPDDNGELVPLGPDPLIGTLFDRKYEIISVLGKGGMSVVYKAKHKYMDRIVAIKVLAEHLVHDQTARLRFEQESRATSALAHQNVVTVHDFGFTPSGQAYFVMDCLDGESLADILEREGSIEIHRAIDTFKQVCDGLEPAHKLGLIHRDLKPSNVVLMKQEGGGELVKIVDFGIAKFLPRQNDPVQQKLTQTGEVFGSPLYMSPEQCQGQTLDPRSDIYSMGCLMYETLTGVPPYVGESFFVIAARHINNEPPAFSDRVPEKSIPIAIEEVVRKCMFRDPADRFQTVGELRQSLLDAALFSGLSGVRVGGVSDPRPGSPAALTWESLAFPFGNTTKRKQEQHRLPIGLWIMAAVPLVLLSGAMAVGFFWQGPAGDTGTPFSKMRWQFDMTMAQQAAGSRNFDAAKTYLLDAVALAKKFGDNEGREKLTLKQLADVYGQLSMFAAQQAANQQILDIEGSQLLVESKQLQAKLDSYAKPSNSGVEVTMGQLEAQANAGIILSCAYRLYAHHMYAQEEMLLQKAIKTFNRLKIEHGVQIADFELAMGNCVLAEQRLPEVRHWLEDALKIMQASADRSNQASMRKLVRAYLRIGQFDRDQSYFEKSKLELAEALKLTRENFASDKSLQLECLNSYADLMRQMGNTAEYRKFTEEAQTVETSIERAQ